MILQIPENIKENYSSSVNKLLVFKKVCKTESHLERNMVSVYLQEFKEAENSNNFIKNFLIGINDNNSKKLLESLGLLEIIFQSFELSKDLFGTLKERNTDFEYYLKSLNYYLNEKIPTRVYRYKVTKNSLECFKIDFNEHFISLFGNKPHEFCLNIIKGMINDYFYLENGFNDFFFTFLNNSFFNCYLDKPKLSLKISILNNRNIKNNCNVEHFLISFLSCDYIEIAIIEKIIPDIYNNNNSEENIFEKNLIENQEKEILENRKSFIQNFYPEKYFILCKEIYYEENKNKICSFKDLKTKEK